MIKKTAAAKKNQKLHRDFANRDGEEPASSATARSLAILSDVSASDTPVSAIELALKLGLPKATVHRLMQLLERLGYLQRAPGSKRFIVGHKQTEMSLSTLTNSPQRAVRHAILRALVDEVQETCNITVLAGDEIAYLDRFESHWPLRTHMQPGSRVPLHCSASGKLFLSLLPAEQRRRLLHAAPLKKYTEKTMTNAGDVEQSLKAIRKTRIGVDNEEFMQGLIGVAVPVLDRKGKICATVSIHVPSSRKSMTQAVHYAPALNRAASAISKTLEP